MSAFKQAADRLAAAERAHADAPEDPAIERQTEAELRAARAAIVAMTPSTLSELRVVIQVLAAELDHAEPSDVTSGGTIDDAVGTTLRFLAAAA